MTRDTVMKALLYRSALIWDRQVKVVGAPRFKWLGAQSFIGNYVSDRRGNTYWLHNWEEVESCVASMIAAQPAVARVL
jgi:hypothetical protein